MTSKDQASIPTLFSSDALYESETGASQSRLSLGVDRLGVLVCYCGRGLCHHVCVCARAYSRGKNTWKVLRVLGWTKRAGFFDYFVAFWV